MIPTYETAAPIPQVPISILAWGTDIRHRLDTLSLGILDSFVKRGFEIVDLDAPSQLQLFLDLPEHISPSLSFGSNAALVVFEPRVVNPYEYRSDVLDRFAHVIRISHLQQLNAKTIDWRQGQIPEHLKPRPRRNLEALAVKSLTIGMINENKQSLVRGSEYATRVRAIRELSRAGFNISVAGKNWDRPLRWLAFKYIKELQRALRGKAAISLANIIFFRSSSKSLERVNFLGPVLDAVEYLETVDIALVIENERTYVSEKLFQALFAGAIPIYIGPQLTNFDIPKVAMEFSGSISDLPEFVLTLTQDEILETLHTGQTWLRSEEAKRFWGVDGSRHALVKVVEQILGY